MKEMKVSRAAKLLTGIVCLECDKFRMCSILIIFGNIWFRVLVRRLIRQFGVDPFDWGATESLFYIFIDEGSKPKSVMVTVVHRVVLNILIKKKKRLLFWLLHRFSSESHFRYAKSEISACEGINSQETQGRRVIPFSILSVLNYSVCVNHLC